jgi:hypothetical protein
MLVLGCMLCLISLLILHLLFTLRYHYPLARLNYIFQLCGSSILLIYVAVNIGIVSTKLKARCHVWPYMFDYTEIVLPESDWDTGIYTAWLLMEGLTALGCHVRFVLSLPSC